MVVIVTDFGSYLCKHSERMIVTNRKLETREEYPLIDLEEVLILNRGVSISSDLIFECQKRTINITFIDKQSDIHVSFDNENSIRDPGVKKVQASLNAS